MPAATSRRTWLALLVLLPAAIVFGHTAFQALHVGFLADDYYAGEVILKHVEEHPGVVERIATTFTRRWAPDLAFWHRPLLPLSFQLDYALFGPNGRIHHLTSLLLWAGIAAAAASLVARLAKPDRPLVPAVVAALALVYPAGVEALGWLAARDDLFLAFFGLMALRARVARPDRIGAGILWLALALLVKETAVVLVPLLNLVAVLVPREPSAGRPIGAGRRIAREALPWVALALWFALRWHVLGTLGSSYGPTSYFGKLRENPGKFAADYVLFFGHSVLQLVAPANAAILRAIEHNVDRQGGLALPVAAYRAASMGAAAVILVLGLGFCRKPGDLKRALLLLGGVLAPLVLLSPVYCVDLELNGSRALAFPAACWIVLLGLAFDRACRFLMTRIPAVLAVVTLFLVASLNMAIAIGAYVNATIAAEGALESLAAVPPGDEIMMVRTHIVPSGMRGDLIKLDGAYVLSSGLYPALAPPFRPGPRVWLEIPESDEAVLAFPAGKVRPWLLTLPPETVRRPRFEVVAEGRSAGSAPDLSPRHGSTLGRDDPLVFRAAAPPESWAGAASIAVVTADLEGHRARAALSEGALSEAKATGRFEVRPEDFMPPVAAEALRLARPRVIVWWVEAEDSGGAVVVRSPWQALKLGAVP